MGAVNCRRSFLDEEVRTRRFASLGFQSREDLNSNGIFSLVVFCVSVLSG